MYLMFSLKSFGMASVKVFPRLDKKNRTGKVPIYLRLTKNRKSKFLALDIYICPEDWNPKTGKMKSHAKNSSQINNYIATKKAEAEAIALEMESKPRSISAYDIKTKLTHKVPTDFFAFTKRQEKMLFENLSIGTFRHYCSVITKLKQFVHNEALSFEDINVRFIKDFQEYMTLTLHNSVNTIHANLKILKKIVADAIAEELILPEKNPFNKIKLKTQKTSRLFLRDDELEKMETLELNDSSMLHHHRNLYIFSAYSGGIRISDALSLRWRNFDGTHLCFQIRKTREDLSIKMPEKSLVILEFYRKMAQTRSGSIDVDPESFIFPLLRINPDEEDRVKFFNAISAATAYTNKDLRKLSRLTDINKKISFHSARHSWAVRALQRGMRIEYVSKIMGHSSVKQTEVYAKILNEELDKAMEVFNKKY